MSRYVRSFARGTQSVGTRRRQFTPPYEGGNWMATLPPIRLLRPLRLFLLECRLRFHSLRRVLEQVAVVPPTIVIEDRILFLQVPAKKLSRLALLLRRGFF